jgi:hypothetical protein
LTIVDLKGYKETRIKKGSHLLSPVISFTPVSFFVLNEPTMSISNNKDTEAIEIIATGKPFFKLSRS